MTLDECINEIKAHHFPNPPASQSAIDALASSIEWPIPADLRSFWLASNGARLFDEVDPPFDFVSIEKFHSIAIDVLGELDDQCVPSAWFSLAHVQDGNYIAIDLASVDRDSTDRDSADYLDAFHETLGETGSHKIIARSFTELLSAALQSGGEHYWLDEGFAGYGDR